MHGFVQEFRLLYSVPQKDRTRIQKVSGAFLMLGALFYKVLCTALRASEVNADGIANRN